MKTLLAYRHQEKVESLLKDIEAVEEKLGLNRYETRLRYLAIAEHHIEGIIDSISILTRDIRLNKTFKDKLDWHLNYYEEMLSAIDIIRKNF